MRAAGSRTAGVRGRAERSAPRRACASCRVRRHTGARNAGRTRSTVAARALKPGEAVRWRAGTSLTGEQLGDLHRWRRDDFETLMEVLPLLDQTRLAQFTSELMPAEVRKITELQLVRRQQLRAETVVAQLNNLAVENVEVDADRLGFWLDLLSDRQVKDLWRGCGSGARDLIRASLLDDRRVSMLAGSVAPEVPPAPEEVLAALRKPGCREPLRTLHATWKQRYGPFAYSDPKDYTVLQGGKKGRVVTPNARFSDYDVRRIKAMGPMLHDLVIQQWDLPARTASGGAKKADGRKDVVSSKSKRAAKDEGGEHRRTRDQELEAFSVKRTYQDERFQFIHPEVAWDTKALVKQPKWRKMRKMPFMEFYDGLRKRNWTSPHFDSKSEPWQVEVYLDGGQKWPRSAFGVRAVVTTQDGGQRWVSMPNPGSESTQVDRQADGGPGGIYSVERLPVEKGITDYGYLQAFEQIGQAYEPYLPEEARGSVFSREGAVEPGSYSYVDPGADLLRTSFLVTPPRKDVVFGLLQLRWFAVGGALLGVFLYAFVYNITMRTKAKDRRKGAFEDMNEAIDFGRSRADARMEGKTGVQIASVAGIDYLKEELEEVVALLKDPGKYGQFRVVPPKGILLMGPPGVGKTLIAKAIAGEAGVPFYSLAGSEFTELIVGVGAARVRDIFKRARVNVPCLIFIDEIEALGHTREMNDSESRNEERDQALNQLLTEMDGFTPDTGIVVMAATNAPGLIDPALMRPGRFDRKVQVRMPNVEARRAILECHATKHPLAEDVDLDQLANDTPGLSGAELEKVLNEAALEALRAGRNEVSKADARVALDRVLEGSALPPLPSHYACNETFACHEAGVAVMSEILRRQAARQDPAGNHAVQEVKSLSLLPRNRSWSRVTYMMSAEKGHRMSTGEDLRRQMQILLAGRACEEVIRGEATSYGALDMARAADVAVKAVNSGLSEAGVLPYTFPHDFFTRGVIFSDPQVQVTRQELLDIASGMSTNDPLGMTEPSEATKAKAERAVRVLVEECYSRNLALLNEWRTAVEATRDALLERKEITRSELLSIMDANDPARADHVAFGGNGQR